MMIFNSFTVANDYNCRGRRFFLATNKTFEDRLTASWFAIEKQENERNVRDPEVCIGFSLRGRRVVEL